MAIDLQEQADRFTKLEDKVDKFGDIFKQIAISQELMQQELRMMNSTLLKVDGMNLQFITCSTSCNMKIKQLESEMNIHLGVCQEKANTFDRMFEKRDKIILTLTTGIILLMVTTLIQQILK